MPVTPLKILQDRFPNFHWSENQHTPHVGWIRGTTYADRNQNLPSLAVYVRPDLKATVTQQADFYSGEEDLVGVDVSSRLNDLEATMCDLAQEVIDTSIQAARDALRLVPEIRPDYEDLVLPEEINLEQIKREACTLLVDNVIRDYDKAMKTTVMLKGPGAEWFNAWARDVGTLLGALANPESINMTKLQEPLAPYGSALEFAVKADPNMILPGILKPE